jgi:hypothetical protein
MNYRVAVIGGGMAGTTIARDMGPCQGRICGATAAEVAAEARGVPVEQIQPYRTRFPTKPLTLGELTAPHQNV